MLNTEQELWSLFKSGDLNGFDGLYKKYSQSLYAYGMKICGDPETIEDTIHDLFAELWSRNNRLPDPDNIRSYLFKALRNKLLKLLKKRKNLPIDELPEAAFPLTISHEVKIIDQEKDSLLKARLQKALNQLTERQREIMYLKFNEGLSYENIADIMRINYQSVVNIIYRAINKLRKHVGISGAVLTALLQRVV